jgi:hypothetical protein
MSEVISFPFVASDAAYWGCIGDDGLNRDRKVDRGALTQFTL